MSEDFNRRATDKEQDEHLRESILDALEKVEDPGYRTVVRLLSKVVDSIDSKLERYLSNDEELRQIVLNGHSAVHDEHHRWAAVQLESARLFEEHHRWVAEQIEAEKLNGKSKRTVLETVASGVVYAVLMLVLTAVAFYLGHVAHL